MIAGFLEDFKKQDLIYNRRSFQSCRAIPFGKGLFKTIQYALQNVTFLIIVHVIVETLHPSYEALHGVSKDVGVNQDSGLRV